MSTVTGGESKVSSAASTFPDSKRVVYAKNPLATVICQLRFPPILRIDVEAPVEFQERIRHAFPLLREKVPEHEMPVPDDLPDALKDLLRESANKRTRRSAYDFVSRDKTWTVGLTREFIAVSTEKYVEWKEFREKLQSPLDALISVYKPDFFTRIGLRYVNVIHRSILGEGNAGWEELLKPHIAGVFSAEGRGGDVKECYTQLLIGFSDKAGSLRVRHGIIQTADNKDEDKYLIDNDFFTEENTEIKHATDTLDHFNRQSGHFFRWCIQDRLHQAMGPQPGIAFT